MYIKKTITLPKELEMEAKKRLVGKRYSNLSEVIRDGIRKLLDEQRGEEQIESVATLYKEGKVTMREAADLLRMSLREALSELARRGAYLRYGEKELAEDLV